MVKKVDISKVSSFNQFLLWFSLVVFIDTYLILVNDQNIFDLNFQFIQNNTGGVLFAFVVYLFCMSVFGKVATWIISTLSLMKELILIKFFHRTSNSINSSNQILDFQALNLSILHNNSVLHKEYLDHKKNIEDLFFEKELASALVVLCSFNYLISNENTVSLFKSYELFLDNQTWYIEIFNILPISIIGYVCILAFKDIGEHYYMYLDKSIQDKLLVEEK